MKTHFFLALTFAFILTQFSNLNAGSKIVILGSSTAAGAGVTNPDNAWVARYSTYVKQIDPSNTIVNLAKGGYTTYAIMPTGTAGYQAGEHLLEPDPERNITKALSLNPDAIIINMPTNDVSNGIPVDQQMDNFNAIITLAKQQGVPVWISTSQPHNFGEIYAGPYSESNKPDLYKQAARDQFKELTERIIATYREQAIDFYYDIATEDGYSFIKPEYNSGDGVHLNDNAHDILFNNVKNKNIIETIGGQEDVSLIPVFINFGGQANHTKWNDFFGQSAGYGIENLLDTTGAQTPLSLHIVTGFTHINSTSGAASSILEMNDLISKSNLCSNGADPVLTFSGLTSGIPYSFKIFASRSGDGDRTTIYNLSGLNQQKDSLNASYNSSVFVSIDSIYASTSGNITLTISKGINNTAGYSYINALHIQPDIKEVLPYNGFIEVVSAGSLSDYLPANADTITTLVISGELNGTDIKTIRELTALQNLDMSNSSILAGGVAYYNGLTTKNNTFPQEMFYNNTTLKSIVLPQSITSIPYHTFMGCTALERVVIPETVSTFGNDIFSGCINLTDVNMPATMTSIGTAIFYNCKKLTSVVFPTGIDAIPGAMFYNCNVLENINIPEGVTSIGQWSFSYCYAMEEVILPSTLSSITEYTFYNCSGIRTIKCKATAIPSCTSTPFGGTTGSNLKNNATLYVPEESLQLYSNDAVWGEIKNIMPLNGTTTNTKDINHGFQVYVSNGICIIKSDNNTLLPIYDISGKVVCIEQLNIGINYINNLQKGVYIINKQKVIL